MEKVFCDLIPELTSNNSSQDIGTAFESTAAGDDWKAYKAFDKNDASNWASNSLNNITFPQYIGFTFTSQKIISKIKFKLNAHSSIGSYDNSSVPIIIQIIDENDEVSYENNLIIKNPCDFNEISFSSLKKCKTIKVLLNAYVYCGANYSSDSYKYAGLAELYVYGK